MIDASLLKAPEMPANGWHLRLYSDGTSIFAVKLGDFSAFAPQTGDLNCLTYDGSFGRWFQREGWPSIYLSSVFRLCCISS